MRTRIASIALGSLLAAQSAYSADVAYQVDANRLSLTEQTDAPEPASIAIVNREWCVPGVEQFWSGVALDNTFRSQRRYELSSSRAEFPALRWSGTKRKFVDDGPWLFSDDVWPLTVNLWNDAELMPLTGLNGMSLATHD